MGYAIPTEDVKPILDNLKNVTTRTKVTDSEDQGFMGITPYDISDEAKQLYGVPAGAYVYEVQKAPQLRKQVLLPVISLPRLTV